MSECQLATDSIANGASPEADFGECRLLAERAPRPYRLRPRRGDHLDSSVRANAPDRSLALTQTPTERTNKREQPLLIANSGPITERVRVSVLQRVRRPYPFDPEQLFDQRGAIVEFGYQGDAEAGSANTCCQLRRDIDRPSD